MGCWEEEDHTSGLKVGDRAGSPQGKGTKKKIKLNHTQNITVISDKRFDEKESCKLTTELRVWCNW